MVVLKWNFIAELAGHKCAIQPPHRSADSEFNRVRQRDTQGHSASENVPERPEKALLGRSVCDGEYNLGRCAAELVLKTRENRWLYGGSFPQLQYENHIDFPQSNQALTTATTAYFNFSLFVLRQLL
jgi:hypothetical protein